MSVGEAGASAGSAKLDAEYEGAIDRCVDAKTLESCGKAAEDLGTVVAVTAAGAAAAAACSPAGPLASLGCGYVATIFTEWAISSVVPAIVDFFGGLFGQRVKPPSLIEGGFDPWQRPDYTFRYHLNPIAPSDRPKDSYGRPKAAMENPMEADIASAIILLQNLWAEYDVGPFEAYGANEVLLRLVQLHGAPLVPNAQDGVYAWNTVPDRSAYLQWLEMPAPRPRVGPYQDDYRFTRTLERDFDGKSPSGAPWLTRPDYWVGDTKQVYLERFGGVVNEANMRHFYEVSIAGWRNLFARAVSREAVALAAAPLEQKMYKMQQASLEAERAEARTQLLAWGALMEALGLPADAPLEAASAAMRDVGLEPGVSALWLGECNNNVDCFRARALQEIGAARLRAAQNLQAYSNIARTVGLDPSASPEELSSALDRYGITEEQATTWQAECLGNAECFEARVTGHVRGVKRRRLAIGAGIAATGGVAAWAWLRR